MFVGYCFYFCLFQYLLASLKTRAYFNCTLIYMTMIMFMLDATAANSKTSLMWFLYQLWFLYVVGWKIFMIFSILVVLK